MANSSAPAAVPPSAGSNKSMPASRLAVSPSVTKWLGVAVIAVAIALILGLIVSVASSGNHKSKQVERPTLSVPAVAVPLANAPLSSWTKLVIPPNGESGRILLPSGMKHIRAFGDAYRLYTVYADGTECSAFGEEKCAGAALEYYVRNGKGEQNTVLYAFVPR